MLAKTFVEYHIVEYHKIINLDKRLSLLIYADVWNPCECEYRCVYVPKQWFQVRNTWNFEMFCCAAGEVTAVGHGGSGALQEPHPQLHTRLHCGCGGVRYHKWVFYMHLQYLHTHNMFASVNNSFLECIGCKEHWIQEYSKTHSEVFIWAKITSIKLFQRLTKISL